MGCDGKNQVNLTNHSAEDKQPSWASGGRLAFSSNRDAAGGFDIYLLTLDPWGIARLTTNAADDESPALSPDGGKVAFVSYRDGDAEIYVLDFSSNTLTNFTNNAVPMTWIRLGRPTAPARVRQRPRRRFRHLHPIPMTART